MKIYIANYCSNLLHFLTNTILNTCCALEYMRKPLRLLLVIYLFIYWFHQLADILLWQTTFGPDHNNIFLFNII